MPQEEEAQSSSASSAVATTTTVVINPEKKEKKKKGEEEERKVVKEQTNHTKCCWYLNHKHRYCTALRLSAMKSRNYGRKQEQPEPEEQQSQSSLTSASAKSLPYDGIYCPLHTKQFELLQQQQQSTGGGGGVGHGGKSGSAAKEDTAVGSKPVNSMSSEGALTAAVVTDERVVCPYSKGKHMVRKSKLESHLKVCPDKKAHDDSIAKPYFKLDVNYGWEFAAATQATLMSSATMPTTEDLNKKAAASTFTCKKEFGDVSRLFNQPTTAASGGEGGNNDHEHNNDDERDDQLTYHQQFDELVDELPLPNPTDTSRTEEEEEEQGQRRDARRSSVSLRHFKQLTNDHGLPALVRFLGDVHNNFRESGIVDVVVDHRTILNSNTTTGDGGKEEGEKKEEQNTDGDEQHSVFPTHHSPVSYNLSEATLASFWEYCQQHREKHTTQHAALLHQILNVAGTTRATTADAMSFMELGAGKGGLAAAVKEVLPEHRIVVADQAVFRDMVDKKKKTKKMNSSSTISAPPPNTPASTPSIERVVVNVKDFDMKQYCLSLASGREGREAQEEEAGHEAWMVLGKHLCGGCTDFALHCAVNATTTTKNASTTTPTTSTTTSTSAAPSFAADIEGRPQQQCSSASVDGIVIATCCHQLCSWECFFAHRHSNSGAEGCPPSETSKPAVLQVFPTRAHFECTRSISSWAIGGATVDAEKRRIGRMAKYALDAARVLALRNTGLFDSVELVEYVKEDVSGENVCIVAKKKKEQ